MMRTIVWMGLVGLWACAGLAQEAPPVINGGGATLRDLVGTGKLVTVVLKERGATDQNLKVVDVGSDYFAVQSPTGERVPYTFASVAEIRVQDGKVETKKFALDEARSMTPDEQRVVDRAFDRAREIFDAANVDQRVKMRAATLLALSGKKESHEYLRRLADSNDLETQLDAALCLYQVNDREVSPSLLVQGLQSGNRKVKAKAATLAGLLGDTTVTPLLEKMVRDRAADIALPAARALGWLKHQAAMPALMKLIQEADEDKGEAALFALEQMGGDEVIRQAKELLDSTTGRIHYRLVVLLYDLEDPAGKDLLIQQMNEFPTLAPDAALILAKSGYWDAVQYLVAKLQKRYDEDDIPVMTFRAKAAAALIMGGDPNAVSYLQSLMRTEKPVVKREICMQIAETGKRKLIPVLQPLMENASGNIALNACYSVVALAKSDFRQRFLDTNR